MFINATRKGTTKTNLTTGKGNSPVKCLLTIISNKGKPNKDKLKISSNLQPVNNNKGNLNPVIHKAGNKWIGRLKTEAREHKIIIGRSSKEVVAEVDQVEVVADPEVEAAVAEEEDNFNKILNYQILWD